MASIYFAVHYTIQKMIGSSEYAYIPPSVFLGIIIFFLFGLLLFSSSISALGFLLLSKDLDLVLSAPVNRFSFFWAKLLETTGSATWMVLVFGAPAILAFANMYHAGPYFYLMTLVAFLPLFLIPSALGILMIISATSLIPASRTREILILCGGLFVVGLYFAAKALLPEAPTQMDTINDFLHIVTYLQVPNQDWSPAFWTSQILGRLLEPNGSNIWPYLGALYSSAITLGALGYIVCRLFHGRAYSMAKSSARGIKVNSRNRQRIIGFFSPLIGPEYRALLSKEISVFLRDMTQAVQLMLLLGLCAVYLYNLKILRVVEELPYEARVWWQAFLVIANLAMGAFVIAAVCTRFVFPSVSLEGQSYWVLRASPLSIGQILRAKFWIWLVPVATIGSVLLTSGALAIRAEPHIVVVSGIASWIVCYGIVGLGVGLGSVYANFNWEHSSQLAASFGSLIYMVASTTLIAINVVPITVLILLRSMHTMNINLSNYEWYLTVSSAALLLVYLNYATARWALKLGENSLLEREK